MKRENVPHAHLAYSERNDVLRTELARRLLPRLRERVESVARRGAV